MYPSVDTREHRHHDSYEPISNLRHLCSLCARNQVYHYSPLSSAVKIHVDGMAFLVAASARILRGILCTSTCASGKNTKVTADASLRHIRRKSPLLLRITRRSALFVLLLGSEPLRLFKLSFSSCYGRSLAIANYVIGPRKQ